MLTAPKRDPDMKTKEKAMDDYNDKKLREAFKLVCRKCGSENCVINLDGGTVYSEHSSDSASLTLGCNRAAAASPWGSAAAHC